MKKTTLAVLVGSLSLGALATGCASNKAAEKEPAVESTESAAPAAEGTESGATTTEEKGTQGSCGAGSCGAGSCGSKQ